MTWGVDLDEDVVRGTSSAHAGAENCKRAVMFPASTPLFFPQLGSFYQSLFPWTEALLRASVGLALVPHGLRNTFGLFA